MLATWTMEILVDSAVSKVPLSGFLARALGHFATHPFALLTFAVTAGLALTVLQNALSVANNYVNTRLDQNIVLDFRTALFEHTERLSMSYHDRRRAGMLIYVINSQGDAVARLIMTVPQMRQSVLMLLGMFWR